MSGARRPSNRFVSSNVRMVNVELAMAVGLNGALVLQQVYYWLEKSKHQHDGRVWVYNTYEEWQQQFPWWSERTLQRIFRDLEEQKVLLVGNYNALKIDRTKWYAIDYEAVDRLCDGVTKVTTSSRQPDDTHVDKLSSPLPEDYQKTTSLDTRPDGKRSLTIAKSLHTLFPGLNGTDIAAYSFEYTKIGATGPEIDRKYKRLLASWAGKPYQVTARSLLNNWSKIDGEPDIDEAEYWAGADYS